MRRPLHNTENGAAHWSRLAHDLLPWCWGRTAIPQLVCETLALPSGIKGSIMATKQPMVTAVFRDRANAQMVYDELMARGYTQKEINVLMSDATRATYYAENRESIKPSTHAAEGMAAGGVIGTAIGATLAAVVAIGTSFAFAGLPLVIAGPIVAAFAGAGAGAVSGGIIGGLIGLGLSESNAK